MAAHSSRTPSPTGPALRSILAVVVTIGVLAAMAACDSGGSPPSTPAMPAGRSTPSPTSPPADPTVGWTPYHDASDHVSLHYPPAWQHRTCTVGTHTSLYLAPSPAALGVCASGFTGQISIVILDGDQRSALHLTGSAHISGAVTVGGVDGTFEQDVAVASGGGLGPAAGTVEAQYVFFTGGRTYRIAYAQAPSGPISADVREDFNLIIDRTLAFV